jgi:hypothetical protein
MEWINFICLNCKHFNSNNPDGLLQGCRAFPDGIPDEPIMSIYPDGSVVDEQVFKNKHDSKLKGQIGDYLYDPIDPEIN